MHSLRVRYQFKTMIEKNFLSNISAFGGKAYQIWVVKFWIYWVVNDLWDVVEIDHVLELFKEPIDTQIRNHRVIVRQKSKYSIHISFFDAVFTKKITFDLIKNKLFSIKIKGKSFPMNWSDLDISKVEHDEIKNSYLERIQEEIIDKPINGNDKIYEESYKSFKTFFIYLITSILCVKYFLYRFKYRR